MKRWTKRTPQEIILSDEEHLHMWELKRIERSPCAICAAVSESFPYCTSHPFCGDCTLHARSCGVKECPMCPQAPWNLHLRCQVCSEITIFENEICQRKEFECCTRQEINLIRIFQRSQQSQQRQCFTNFITPEESLKLEEEVRKNNYAPSCWCGQALEKTSACNDVFHCGKQSVCYACGCRSFPWESGISKHREESKCPLYFYQDDLARQHGEHEAMRIRFRQELTKVLQNF